MENETKPPPPEPVLPRFHFHLVLGLVFLPFLAAGLGAVLAAGHLFRKHATALQVRWTRLLLVLVVVDVLFAISCYRAMTNPELLKQPARSVETPRIGVVFDPAAEKGEPRIAEILPGSPAERAGFEVGDVVERVDGVPVSTAKELLDLVQKEGLVKARTLVVRRGEVTEEIVVTPELPPKSAARGLFEGRPSSDAVDWLGLLTQFLPAAGAGLVVWLASLKRARTRVIVWRGLLIATVGSVAASVATGFLVKAIVGGWSIGGALLALLSQMAVLLALTHGVERWFAFKEGVPASPISPLRAGFAGLFYLITGIPRVSVLLWMADQVFLRGQGMPANQVLDALAAAPLGDLGTGLFVFVVVFLGPLAEETLFRGFLLPRLSAQWGAGWALFGSALIFALFHPHYGMYMPVVFLYGWVFGWARLRSGGIGASWFLHVAVNGAVSALMLSR